MSPELELGAPRATPAATARGATVGAGSRSRSTSTSWERRYRYAVVSSDLAAVAVAIAVAAVLPLGDRISYLPGSAFPVLALGVGLLVVFCLAASGSWKHRVLGQGSDEFARLIRAYAGAAITLALLGLALQVSALRPWVFGIVPLAGALSVCGRYVLRKILHRRRSRGRCLRPVLAVGTTDSVSDLIRRTRNDPHNGWIVTAACTPTGSGHGGAVHVDGVPVSGDLDSVAELVARGSHDVVAVGDTPGWSPVRLRQLAWDIEGHGVDLVVDPGLMEMAGPRLHVAPVDGIPLLRLTHPDIDGLSRVVKVAIDVLGAVLLLVAVAPLMLTISLAVRLSGGPVFYRQERVGKDGRPFSMIKFRTMVVDADEQRATLLALNEGSGPLFKLRADPRVTRIGAVLRRYSLDELPQLINVLAGTMSLVGPRPPLPEEVRTYTPDAARKLRVKPGLTGLWQVNGRSDLSWEESVRMDLRYVENWTLAMDVQILWKTVGAIIRSRGAY